VLKGKDKLLADKKELLSRFLRLTREQSECMSDEAYAQLGELSNIKQDLIEQIDAIDKRLSNRERISFTHTNQEINKEIQEIIAETLSIDRDNNKLLETMKRDTLEKIKHTKIRRRMHSLYRGDHLSIEGTLLDRKG